MTKIAYYIDNRGYYNQVMDMEEKNIEQRNKYMTGFILSLLNDTLYKNGQITEDVKNKIHLKITNDYSFK